MEEQLCKSALILLPHPVMALASEKEELMETVILTKDKTTPGTTRFSSDSDVVSNIYIKKPYFSEAKKIRITIEEATEE